VSATRVATLDGTWELAPVMVLQLVGADPWVGFQITHDDVQVLIDLIDDEPDIEDCGFSVVINTSADGSQEIIELPPGEPSRNAIAALRWFNAAIMAAGPMPATP
jgi:hypothetical protein